ncbi:hypothetical protein Bca52824_084319 [Brassica carinata]|uniref:DUF1985 domain-containing protein n=1 Tax=Brassica carinata TaxID=52824 RepID=A0A8X7PNW5_BRACI|nr:hypothetical protein Bca52824_084319 [Brassica carinata]
MEGEDNSPPPLTLPQRIFAVGSEPVGVRVTPYHKPHAIRQILNSLDPEEVDAIRSSPFGKLVEIADKPSFSGRFGRFIISRQLKVDKKHEAWFIFSGKPVRFSLREFAYVTGLNCGKLPKHQKKRSEKFLSQKPYWGELFGSMKDVPVTSVVRMLKKRTVTDRGMRLKYAFLALLSAVILPTTHTPRISQVYAERIKNLDDFFSYPWGRISFDMLMTSIKERNEVSLSQNTIALKGFVLSLQLVMVEAIPALTEVGNDGTSSGSEGDGGEDDDIADEDQNAKRTISPGNARDSDASGKVEVRSVIVEGKEHFHASPEYSWSDDEDDTIVENLLTLVEHKYPFKNASFVGGVTTLDVIRMREEAKTEATNRKTVKPKQTKHTTTSEVIDFESVAAVVKEKMSGDFSRIERQISTLSETFLTFQNNVLDKLQLLLHKLEDSNVRSGVPSSSQPGTCSNVNVDVHQAEISRQTLHPVGNKTAFSENEIISEAIRFANQSTSPSVGGLNVGGPVQFQPVVPPEAETPCGVDDVTILPNQTTKYKDDVLNGEPLIQQRVHTEREIPRVKDAELVSDELSDIIPPSKQASTAADNELNGSQDFHPSVQYEGQTATERSNEMVIDDTTNATIAMDQVNSNCDDALNVEQQIQSPIDYPVRTLNIAREEMAKEFGLEEMVSSYPPTSQDSTQTAPAPDTNLDPALVFPNPTFSLGLTQEEPLPTKQSVSEVDCSFECVAGNENCDQEDQMLACRKSKRHKTLPKSLVGQYECDKRLLNRARAALVDPNNTGGSSDYSAKFSALIDKLKSPFTIRIGQSTFANSDLRDCS